MMNFFESISGVSYRVYSIVMIVIGLGLVVLAFTNSPVQLQVALGLAGLGFISLGLVQVKRAQHEKKDEERFSQIMNKLDQIQQSLKKTENPERKGIAIADFLTTGLKYYAEHITPPEKKEKS